MLNKALLLTQVSDQSIKRSGYVSSTLRQFESIVPSGNMMSPSQKEVPTQSFLYFPIILAIISAGSLIPACTQMIIVN